MDPIIGMIFIWSVPWCPAYFNYCNGTALSVAQNQALFSLIGTTYGGNNTNFNLPDLRGRVPVGATTMGAGIPPWVSSTYNLAATGGIEKVTLAATQVPLVPHTHTATLGGSATATLTGLTASGTLKATAQPGSTNTPGTNAVPAQVPNTASTDDRILAYGTPDNSTTMPVTVTVTPPAGGLPVDLSKGTVAVGTSGAQATASLINLQPFIALNYIIALQGVYPDRP